MNDQKLDLIGWISGSKDSVLIERLWKMKSEYVKSKDWWETLDKEELESIERGLADIENNRVHTHDEAKKVYEKYL